jgi:hypothetical protein
MSHRRSRILRWWIALAVPWTAVACTTSSPQAVRVTPAPNSIGGTILAAAATDSSASAVAFRLPSETVTPVNTGQPIPIVTYTVTHASAADPAGGLDLLVTDEHHRASAYRITTSGAATAAGPPLPTGKPDPYHSLSVAGGKALVASCSRISVLSFDDPRGWRPVAKGCWAGLSPDGNSLVYSADGAEIDQLRLPSGRPSKLLDTSQLESIFPPGFATPSLVGPPVWGRNGIAFAVRSGADVAVVVREPSGHVRTVFQEPFLGKSQIPRLAWQPGGQLLAIADNMGPTGGVLRLWDPATDHLEAIGLDLLGFSVPQWAPDGSSLAALTSAKSLIVFDPRGTWQLRVETTWRDLLAWGT